VTYLNEITRLLIHACLHLAGYKDSTEYEKKVMKEKEDNFLLIAIKKYLN
jgi:ssRNA-specific RNase YbeY (16S rRNA maturation enzyme)